MPGDYLDLSSEPNPPKKHAPAGQKNSDGARPYIGVRFACCEIYTRVYRNREATAYEGRCPKCAKQVCLRIGGGGTSSRFFEVT